MLAGRTGLEPAASGVTGRRYNQLNYRPEAVATLPSTINPEVSKIKVTSLAGVQRPLGAGGGADRRWPTVARRRAAALGLSTIPEVGLAWRSKLARPRASHAPDPSE